MRRATMIAGALTAVLLLSAGLPAQIHVVNMVLQSFVDSGTNNATTTVVVGTTVRWQYVSGSQHTVTASGSAAGAFSSPLLSATTPQFNYLTTAPGTYPYVCNVHFLCCNMAGTLIVLPPPSYPGSGEDLRLQTGVNGPAAPFDVSTAVAGDSLALRLDSPMATFNNAPPVIFAQVFLTGFAPVSPSGFPSIHIDPFAVPGPFLIFDGTAGSFAFFGLPSSGLEFFFPSLPPGLTGFSLMIQGLSVTSAAANHIFAVTDGHEIQFL